MKRLYILRHAQAMPAEGQSDKERTLTPNGTADARALGQAMSRKSYQPDLILCSPAIRTRETLDGVAESLKTTSTLYVGRIYEGGTGDLLHAIQKADPDIQSLMLIGHNPSIHALAVMLAQENSTTITNRLVAGYKPGTLTVMDCTCKNWADIKLRENILVDLLEPLDYNAPSTPARWT